MGTVDAIIAAGGSGIRFGQKKQFTQLAGKPILAHTIANFQIPLINRIIVVVPVEDIPDVERMLASLYLPVQIVPGGATRQASVYNGLQAAKGSRIVLIHDGVRPFVSKSLIERVTAGIEGHDACIPGQPVSDTIKEAQNGKIVRTIPRHDVYQIQTPQAFYTGALTAIHAEAAGRSNVPTDDSLLIEEQGGSVRLVEGDPYNMKITLPEDLAIAEAIHAIQNRKRV